MPRGGCARSGGGRGRRLPAADAVADIDEAVDMLHVREDEVKIGQRGQAGATGTIDGEAQGIDRGDGVVQSGGATFRETHSGKDGQVRDERGIGQGKPVDPGPVLLVITAKLGMGERPFIGDKDDQRRTCRAREDAVNGFGDEQVGTADSGRCASY